LSYEVSSDSEDVKRTRAIENGVVKKVKPSIRNMINNVLKKTS